MITDAMLSFVPIGGNLAVTSAAVPSTNVIDLIGVGVGVAPPSIWGTTTVFGQADAMGVGDIRPELNVALGSVNWAGGTSLNVALQGAIDDGTNNPGTWNTFAETGAIAQTSTPNLTRGSDRTGCPRAHRDRQPVIGQPARSRRSHRGSRSR